MPMPTATAEAQATPVTIPTEPQPSEQNQRRRQKKPPGGIENVDPAHPEKILLPLHHAQKHRQPERKQNHRHRDPQAPSRSSISSRQDVCLPDKHTPSATNSARPNVPSHASRIMPASCRSRFVASARAVCCANTICSGMFGTHIATASITPNAPYSAAGRFCFGEEMHHPHHPAAADVRDHQPAALAEKRRVGDWEVVAAGWSGIFSASIGAGK